MRILSIGVHIRQVLISPYVRYVLCHAFALRSQYVLYDVYICFLLGWECAFRCEYHNVCSQRLLFVNCGVYFNPRLYIQHSVPHYNVVVCRPLVVVVGRGGGEEVRV